MKKMSMYTLMLCFCLELHKPLSATGVDDNKKDYVEINTSDLYMESEFLSPSGLIYNDAYDYENFLAGPIAKAKTIGKKALPILPWITIGGLYLGYMYYTSTTCEPDAEKECDPNNEFSLTNIGKTSFNLLGGPFLTAGLFTNKIQKGISNLRKKYLPENMQSDNYKKILKYKREIDKRYAQNKITKKNKERFYQEVSNYDAFAAYGEETSKEAKNYVKTMKRICALPSDVKKFDYNTIKPKLMELLETYPLDIQNKITTIIKEIILASNSNEPKKTIVCFYGPPGTGKTHLAQELAKILDVSMSCFKPSSSKAEKMIAQYIQQDDEEIMLNAFTHKEKNFKNNILFIDEFDCCLKESNDHCAAFRDFFVNVCEKNQKFYPSGKIQGLDIDMSSTIIIMASNELPEDSAILDRIEVIEFKDIPKEKQLPIALNTFKEGLKNYNLHDDISEENNNTLEQIIEKNTFSGVRVLKAIVDKYVLHIAGKYYFEDDGVQFDIEAAYKAYQHEKKAIETAEKENEDAKKNEPKNNKILSSKDKNIIDNLLDL